MANELLRSIKFPDLTDTYIIGDTSLSVAGAGADAKATGDALATKANADGYYSNLTAGSAEQLLSTVTIEDETPYLFRTSGGSIEIGDRETDCIVGGSVAWNQLAKNGTAPSSRAGITITSSEDAFTFDGTTNTVLSASGWFGLTSDVVAPLAGHKVFMGFQLVSGTVSNTDAVSFSPTGRSENLVYLGREKIVSIPTTVNNSEISCNTAGTVFTNAKMRLQCFDLTQMFGSTIADYVYSLEQANAGAGVAWFRKLFNKSYYAYNAGELLSVSGVSAHNMTGFNQWDEEWEVGGIDVITGEPYADNNIIRSKNFIRVMPSAKYYVGSDSVIHELYLYDANKDYKHNAVNYASNNGLFTMPEWCCYIKFRCKQAYGTTYKNDICINLSWDGSENGQYRPYVLHSYALDDSLTLRGIPKISNGSLYYDGDTYESDGTVTRKYGVVDLGTLDWVAYGSSFAGLFYSDSLTSAVGATSNNAPHGVCSTYLVVKDDGNNGAVGSETEQPNKTIRFRAGDGRLYVVNHEYDSATATAFKTAMNGVYLIYELATPTTETADPYTNPQIVDDFGTEEYISTSIVPVGHKTQYMPNLRAKLEMAPDSPSGDGDYIVRQTNGTNEYVLMANNATIQNIISRLEALEGQNG